jgi:serine/threonine-protein kinase
VHRDVSPQNILVTPNGNVKVVDFGIAKITNQEVGLTAAGEVKGKLAYMAPEHLRGQALDCRADLFGLGIVLYLLTTGRHPFKGETPAETVHNTSSVEPLPPSRLVADYPKALERVVLQALSKKVEGRTASARAFLEALECAVPDALTQAAEQKTAEYLGRLLSERCEARRKALRHALDSSAFDPRHGLTLMNSGQSGTMGAVMSEPGSSPTNEQLTALLKANRAAGVRDTLFGAVGALALVSVLGGAMLLGNQGSDDGASSAAAGQPQALPSETSDQPSAPPDEAPVGTPDPVVAEMKKQEDTPATAALVSDEQEDAKPKATVERVKKKSASSGAQPKRSERPRTRPTAEAASEPGLKDTAATPAKPAPSSEAWDRASFGGRW